ncbi:hypothetical protein IGI04_004347 [Brassica rapa subsp. trilocularis]|uniref:RRM domain-containing protein n=3 Tax=Brassica campestris TaxID=3711 RepID=M4EJ61_BRACM|nr:polyadenylate-binding protein, cytoplasmic and nuclear-like [Brassica rapa]KAG5408028.1 hypothetical protein IGI04_004347 [Brassica rapa subsp. trilocularis]
MTSSLLLLMLVTAVFVLTTMLNDLPTCPLRHRYGTELKMSNDDCNESSSCPSQFKSLYIGNLDPRVYEGILIQMLSGFGKITRSILAKDYRGESRGFAFVEFESTHSAEQAVEHMNGRLIGQKIIYVERTPKVDEGQDKTYNNLT